MPSPRRARRALVPLIPLAALSLATEAQRLADDVLAAARERCRAQRARSRGDGLAPPRPPGGSGRRLRRHPTAGCRAGCPDAPRGGRTQPADAEALQAPILRSPLSSRTRRAARQRGVPARRRRLHRLGPGRARLGPAPWRWRPPTSPARSLAASSADPVGGGSAAEAGAAPRGAARAAARGGGFRRRGGGGGFGSGGFGAGRRRRRRTRRGGRW